MVNIEDMSLLKDIKKAISMVKGVIRRTDFYLCMLESEQV